MTAAASPRPRRLSLVAWLRDGAHGATVGRAGAGACNLLVVSQVAMALVLTVGAGLLSANYLNLAEIDLGYRPAEVLALTLAPSDGAYETDASRRIAYRELLARVRNLRGVEAAGGTLLLPFEHGAVGMDGGVVLEANRWMGKTGPSVRQSPCSPYRLVTSRPWGLISWRAARSPTGTPRTPPPRSWSANRSRDTSGRRGNAVGRRLIAVGAEAESDDAPAWQTVVGVVEDARYRKLERGRFDLYVSFTQVSMSLNNHPRPERAALHGDVEA